MKAFLLFPIIALLASCSGNRPKTKTSFQIGFTGNSTNPHLHSGLIIYGKGDNGVDFAFVFPNGNPQPVDIPRGNYVFKAIAWEGQVIDGLKRKLTGNTRCGTSAQNLVDDLAQVSISISQAACNDSDLSITGSWDAGENNFKKLEFTLCRSFFGIAGPGHPCGGDLVNNPTPMALMPDQSLSPTSQGLLEQRDTRAKSYRIEMEGIDPAGNPMVGGLIGPCISLNEFSRGEHYRHKVFGMDHPYRIPVGGTNGWPVRMSLHVYEQGHCRGPDDIIVMPEGMVAGPPGGQRSQFFANDNVNTTNWNGQGCVVTGVQSEFHCELGLIPANNGTGTSLFTWSDNECRTTMLDGVSITTLATCNSSIGTRDRYNSLYLTRNESETGKSPFEGIYPQVRCTGNDGGGNTIEKNCVGQVDQGAEIHAVIPRNPPGTHTFELKFTPVNLINYTSSDCTSDFNTCGPISLGNVSSSSLNCHCNEGECELTVQYSGDIGAGNTGEGTATRLTHSCSLMDNETTPNMYSALFSIYVKQDNQPLFDSGRSAIVDLWEVVGHPRGANIHEYARSHSGGGGGDHDEHEGLGTIGELREMLGANDIGGVLDRAGITSCGQLPTGAMQVIANFVDPFDNTTITIYGGSGTQTRPGWMIGTGVNFQKRIKVEEGADFTAIFEVDCNVWGANSELVNGYYRVSESRNFTYMGQNAQEEGDREMYYQVMHSNLPTIDFHPANQRLEFIESHWSSRVGLEDLHQKIALISVDQTLAGASYSYLNYHGLNHSTHHEDFAGNDIPIRHMGLQILQSKPDSGKVAAWQWFVQNKGTTTNDLPIFPEDGFCTGGTGTWLYGTQAGCEGPGGGTWNNLPAAHTMGSNSIVTAVESEKCVDTADWTVADNNSCSMTLQEMGSQYPNLSMPVQRPGFRSVAAVLEMSDSQNWNMQYLFRMDMNNDCASTGTPGASDKNRFECLFSPVP